MSLLNENVCICCGTCDWLPLPAPVKNQSITTACVLVKEPIGKAQCANCGLVQRIYEDCLGETDYYETRYKGYYERPATLEYHKTRYKKMVDWIYEGIGGCQVGSILDIGCGQGGAMLALQDRYSKVKIDGLEPSVQNSNDAKKFGFNVICSRMGEAITLEKKYDLAIAIYVAQHVLNPVDFFKGVKNSLTENGIAAIVIPNGNIPNIELLWSDQNYAFTANQLISLSEKAGLRFDSLHKSPDEISTSWLVIFKKDNSASKSTTGIQVPEFDKIKLYKKRCAYLEKFNELDEYLCNKVNSSQRVINFGASFWASILAAYCPKYWDLVDFCTVDNDKGEIMGKKVLPFNTINLSSDDSLTIALAKSPQKALFKRFKELYNIEAITWHQIIDG